MVEKKDPGVTREEIMEMIASMKNGMPKTWMELCYKGAMTFGVPVVILAVILLMAYQTFPPWVRANIETQKSLTTNLDRQTQNIEAQTENLTAQTEAIQEVRDSIKRMVADNSAIVKFTENVSAEHAKQAEQHEAMISTLQAIGDKLGE